MSKVLTLWYPGLLDKQKVSEAGKAFHLKNYPYLRKILSRSDRYFAKPRDFFSNACFLFHQPQRLAVAATQRAALLNEKVFDSFWLKVDPVQVIADRDTLLMLPQSELALDESSSKQLLADFNKHFSVDGVTLHYGTQTDWFLDLAQVLDLHTTDLMQAELSPLSDFMPSGSVAPHWRKLMNEAQMLFFSSQVNVERRGAALPEINGVWVWGEGVVKPQQIVSRKNTVVWSDNLYLQGLAVFADAKMTPPPKDYLDWQSSLASLGCLDTEFNGAAGFDSHLVCLNSPQVQGASSSLEGWLNDLDGFEKEWCAPLWEGVCSGDIVDVYFDLGSQHQFFFKASHAKRFWRFNAQV